jgi:outer membrane receptor protein involved in Fe transport
VVTRSGGPLRASALAEGGSRRTMRGAAGVAGTLGRWSFGATGERWTSDGFEGLSAAGERVSNDDGRSHAATIHTGVTTPGWTLAGHLRVLDSERGYPGPFGRDPNGTYAGVDRISRGWNDHLTGGLRAIRTFSPRLRVRGFASWVDLDARFASPFGDSIAESERVDGRGQVDVAAGASLSFTGGFEILRERARSTYITGAGPDPLPVRRRVAGAFAEGRVEPVAGLSIAAGIRVEHIEREALEGNPGVLRPAFPADAVVSANPRASVSWMIRPDAGTGHWTRLRVNAGTGIRPPDAFEIAFTDNPALKPERSRSYDAGMAQGLAGGRAVVDATWFHNAYDDLIVAVGRSYRDASRYQTDNVANARARGLELSVSAQPHVWLAVRAGYTWLDTAVLAVDGGSGAAPAPFAPGDSLIRRPRHQGWLDVVLTAPRASAFARFGGRGRVLDVDPSFGAFGGKLEAAGYAVADAGVSVVLIDTVAVFGRVTNLFDRSYEEVLGFPSPGRAVVAGVRIAASR